MEVGAETVDRALTRAKQLGFSYQIPSVMDDVCFIVLFRFLTSFSFPHHPVTDFSLFTREWKPTSRGGKDGGAVWRGREGEKGELRDDHRIPQLTQ